MIPWWGFVALFIVVAVLMFWMASGEAAARCEFNRRWNAHDIHWDDDRVQWRHDGACPCGKGPYRIGRNTTP